MKCGYLYYSYLFLLLQSKWKQCERLLTKLGKQLAISSRRQRHRQSSPLLMEAKQAEVYHLLVTSPLLAAGTLMLLATVLHGHQGCQTLNGVCVGQSARIVLAIALLAIAFMSLYRSRGRGE